MYVRALTPEARRQLTAGLRSSNAFRLRRCQILLASAREQRPATIARNLGGATPSVRHALHAFDTPGLASLHARSRRPHHTRLVLDAPKRERLRGGAPEPPHVWQGAQHLDLSVSSRGLLGAGPHALSGQHREYPSSPQALGRPLAAGQSLDHQPRSAVCPKKTGAIGSCSWPPSTPTGWWASPMRPGGVGWPTPRGIAGPPKHPCDWWNRSSPREMPSPTPSAARASCGPIPVTSCCALSTAGLSVTSPPLFRRGSVHA
jgi:hypothetical protein